MKIIGEIEINGRIVQWYIMLEILMSESSVEKISHKLHSELVSLGRV